MNSINSTLTDPTQTEKNVWIHMSIIISMIFIDVSAFFGNLLIICAFYRTRRLQTVTNYFIASLAFADALVAIFVLPLGIYHYHQNRLWKLGLILCDLWVSSDVLLCTSSILNLTCISIDRYMAITKPLTYSAYRSKFLARMMILLVWLVSIVITCPPIFGWRDSNRRHEVETKFQCDLNSARGYVVYSALGSFYIPGLVMIFVYIRIFMVVYDRGNLLTNFQDGESSSNSRRTSTINNSPKLEDSSKDKSLLSRCFDCFSLRRQSVTQNSNGNQFRTSLEQNHNGYLVYRFNKTSAKNNSQNLQSATTKNNFSRMKKVNSLAEDVHQYPRNYLTKISVIDYQYRPDETINYDRTNFQRSLSPLLKCRSRSLEQSSNSQTRDINNELVQLKTNKTTTIKLNDSTSNSKTIQHKQDSISENQISSAIDDDLPETTQSLVDLEQIVVKTTNKSIPLRTRSTTNPTISGEGLVSTNVRRVQDSPEPTRINRRMKSTRNAQGTPSSILIENFKQKHQVRRQTSLKSNQSSKSLTSISRNLFSNDSSTTENVHSSSCHCCFVLRSNNSQNKTKNVHFPTPNQSFTNDDDDEEKISSAETPTQIRKSKRKSVQSGGTPGDVQRRERIRFMKEKKTAKILAVVVGGFIILWLPFFIMYVIPRDVYKFSPITVTFITWLGYFNSVINPFIYAYCSKQFRLAFWNITIGICMKKSTVILPLTNKSKQTHQRRMKT